MILAGTGHRPDKVGGYGADIAQRMVKIARGYLTELKPDVVISGMAIGWDQALAWAAIHEKIEWWAYVPFKGQEKMWPPESKMLYHALLTQADSVNIVCPDGYAPWKMQQRNEAMVDACDKVLALWNGGPGGTANCIAYADHVGKPYINAWDRWRLQ
jgi:uncharacterized phage-like protein YoqJ